MRWRLVTRCVSLLCQSLPGGFVTGDSRDNLDGLDFLHVELFTMEVMIANRLKGWIDG